MWRVAGCWAVAWSALGGEPSAQGEHHPSVVHGPVSVFDRALAHVPEPMLFDLVRGLHAERGEVEVNTLVSFRPRRGGFPVAWAPEVEWAFAEGHALEFELPMVDRELKAIKVALQGRLPGSNERFIHGWQFLVEHYLEGETEWNSLYLLGVRPPGRWSAFLMVGPRLVGPDRVERVEILVNPSLFLDASPRVHVGLEVNGWLHPGREVTGEVLLLPQIHVRLSPRVVGQAGAGVAIDFTGRAGPQVATRWILE